MAGNKTHDQQKAIIEKRVNTANAGVDFDAEADLKLSPEERAARDRGRDLDMPRGTGTADPDDRSILRGTHQENEHNKKRADH
ncbi:MAG: hypothetical protein INR68_15815 [Methylobacterium mesophilicum]|nr:hypothetical protein [Methylobacterium mesophilicum]